MPRRACTRQIRERIGPLAKSVNPASAPRRGLVGGRTREREGDPPRPARHSDQGLGWSSWSQRRTGTGGLRDHVQEAAVELARRRDTGCDPSRSCDEARGLHVAARHAHASPMAQRQ